MDNIDAVLTALSGVATFLPPPFNFIVLGVGAGVGVYVALRKRTPPNIQQNPYDKG